MKTFKQFQEEWKRGFPLNNRTFGRERSLHHTANVRGHKVNVIISHHDKEYGDKNLKGHVSADFSVNGSFNSDPEKAPSGEDGKHILHHVHKVLKHYIEKRKPKQVLLAGNTRRKNQIYLTYAKHLAKSIKGSKIENDHEDYPTTIHLGEK